MLKNKCCLYAIISIIFFSITICNLLIESPSYKHLNTEFLRHRKCNSVQLQQQHVNAASGIDKMKQSLCLIQYYAIRHNGDWRYSSTHSETRYQTVVWSASRHSSFTHGERGRPPPNTVWTTVWAVRHVAKAKAAGNSTPSLWSFSPQPSNYCCIWNRILYSRSYVPDRLCGLVVTVSGYRYRGPGFDCKA